MPDGYTDEHSPRSSAETGNTTAGPTFTETSWLPSFDSECPWTPSPDLRPVYVLLGQWLTTITGMTAGVAPTPSQAMFVFRLAIALVSVPASGTYTGFRNPRTPRRLDGLLQSATTKLISRYKFLSGLKSVHGVYQSQSTRNDSALSEKHHHDIGPSTLDPQCTAPQG